MKTEAWILVAGIADLAYLILVHPEWMAQNPDMLVLPMVCLIVGAFGLGRG